MQNDARRAECVLIQRWWVREGTRAERDSPGGKPCEMERKLILVLEKLRERGKVRGERRVEGEYTVTFRRSQLARSQGSGQDQKRPRLS